MKIRDIADRVIYFRDLKNISARELSISVGKNENYINQLESLSFVVPTDILLNIIDNLDIKPEEFFAEDYKNYKTKKAVLSLLEEITKSVSNDKIIELLNSLKK